MDLPPGRILYMHRYTGKNHLLLPEDQIYSPLHGNKISDLISILNSLLPDKSGQAMLPLHSMYVCSW